MNVGRIPSNRSGQSCDLSAVERAGGSSAPNVTTRLYRYNTTRLYRYNTTRLYRYNE